MRILVTGGAGSVGRAVVTRLVQHGHEVRVIGRRAGVIIEGAQYVQCNVTDWDTLREQVRGRDAIVHLAAIPVPWGHAGQEVFRTNCQGTFNVYQAAATEGIQRVACASSINALGYQFGIKRFDIHYLPVDEEHPTFTTDPYSFSKQITEDIAAYYWRREGISSVCLRLPWVYEATPESLGRIKDDLSRLRHSIDELLSLPDDERQERMHPFILRIERLRAARAPDMPRQERARIEQGYTRPEVSASFWRSILWASIHPEDSAQAFEKGLLADYEGSHPLFVCDSHNAAGIEAETLAHVFYPEVQARKRPLGGTESLVNIDKAKELIGFMPELPISQMRGSEEER